MMKYVFILAFVGLCVYATFFDPSAKFDYETANEEARVDWLSGQLKRTDSKINRALSLQYGYFSKTEITAIEVVSGTRLRAILQVGDVTGSWMTSTQKRELQDTLCSVYETLPLARNKVQVQARLKTKKDTFSGRLLLDPRTCHITH